MIIDGKKTAEELRSELKKKIIELKSTYNSIPGLTVILVDSIITIYLWIIIINAILSWLVAFNILNTQNRFVFSVLDTTYKMTDPALNKIRRFIPTFGSVDISPIILILLLMFLRNIIFEIFAPSLF